MIRENILVVLACVSLTQPVSSKYFKSSLTFVIDNTSSMTDDIEQVKEGVVDIFDTVMKSNASDIEDFVLVTFNDPFIEYRVTAKNRDEFMEALGVVEAYCTSTQCGRDCPEMTLTGIERALQESRPNSHLYVFTDASSKDFEKYKKVKELAQKMQSQIVFGLTGQCDGEGNDKVFYDLAKDTSGQVFNLEKDEVELMLTYVEETIKNRRTVITNKNFPTGTHNLPYTVDSAMKEIMISVSGTNPTVVVTDPDGEAAITEDIMRTAKVAIVKVKEVKPGVYNAEISSESDTTVVVSGSTTVHFEHGFSPVKPSSIDDTATRPIPGEESYLALKLNTEEDVKLRTVQIIDMDNNVVLEKSLKLINEKEKFYLADPFTPLNITFRVAIKGYDTKTNTEITRISLTPIEPQTVEDASKTPDKSPNVTIVGESKINVAYNISFQLRCKVAALPKPTVVWEDSEGHVLSSTLAIVEIPYDYVSVLDIERAYKNATYTCKAENGLGHDYKEIEVETVRTRYFDVLEVPKGAVVEFEKEEKFVCNVDARPPATITWYQNRLEVIEDDNISISPNRSILTIKRMLMKYDGHFTCEARNEDESNLFEFSVSISGLKAPEIDKSSTEIRINEGSSADISCRTTSGKPKPFITWNFKHTYSDHTEDRGEGEEVLHIDIANPKHSGTYECKASNIVGSDYHSTELIVEYPPSVEKSTYSKTALEDEEITLSCVVKGEPKPEVKWLFNGAEINKGLHYSIDISNSLSFKATVSDSGVYTCEAMNTLGSASNTINIEVFGAPKINKSSTEIHIREGSSADIECRTTTGNPKPSITWNFKHRYSGYTEDMGVGEEVIHIDHANPEHSGTYGCTASNIVGSDYHSTVLIVEYPPSVEKSSYLKTAKAGEHISLSCSVKGEPKPEVKWLVNGAEIKKGLHYTIHTSNSLSFKATVSDSGVYTCEAVNTLGSVSNTINVEVLEAPEISKYSTEIRIREGSSTDIVCRTTAGNPKPSITWNFINRYSGYIEDRGVGEEVIHIDHANPEHSGTYGCTASNIVGSDFHSTVLIVEYPPSVEKSSYLKTAKEGEHISLSCFVKGEPKPEVKWLVNGVEIKKGLHYSIHTSNSLSFKATASDSGVYTCEAMNSLGSASNRINVEVFEAPKISKHSTEIRIREGSSADIECRITAGKPKPSITWYFKHRYSDRIEDIGEGEEVLHIDHANPGHSGTYGCEALNVVGSDYHHTELIVEYPPSIKKRTNLKTAKEGKRIRLSCFVRGEPKPEVKWFVNGAEINKGLHYRIYTTNTLSFKAIASDSGVYTCEAKNTLGSASNTINVEVFVPPRIETPEEFKVNVDVGDDLKLACHASGYPKPEIKWIFQSIDTKKTAKKLKSGRRGSLKIKRIQRDKEGFYTCIASNAIGLFKIAYEVNICAPPIIEKEYKTKEFISVLGDLVLRVPCKATGNPKPVITWTKGGFKIAKGEFYDIEEDGTLVIKNVDKVAEGDYTCNADNQLTCNADNRHGNDYDTYEVIVEAYPRPGFPTSTVFLDEGKTTPLSCDVLHKRTDLLRWFKDGILLVTGELTLKNVQASDSGIYTCRVSDFSKSKTGYINVKVAYKPRFEYDLDDDHIELQKGEAAVMDCSAEGDPSPEISWWHDGHKIDFTQMVYVFDMTAEDRGEYYCLVENELGQITRKFEISSKECLINIERDLQGNQPLIVSLSLSLPSFPIIDGHMQIRAGEDIRMFCPSGFEGIDRTEIVASCEKETEFNVEEKTYKFSDLKCNDAQQPIIKNTGAVCQLGNTEKIKIGFEIRGRFLEVYEICYDKDNKTPLYSKQTIENSLANTDVKTPEWFENELVPYDFDALYDCDLQVNTISSFLRRWFHKDDMCCFSKRQLVNPRDVYPGLSQTATYSYLNVVPQWSTCSGKNWESVEQRVRNLAKSADRELLVWTGTSHKLKMQREDTKTDVEVKLRDRRYRQQAVPKYLWKVVQDPANRASLAIIQVNTPDLTLSEADHSMLCRDICNRVPWMMDSTWRDLKLGYTYCCNIMDFERAFGYTGTFNSGSGKVLYNFP